MRASRSQYGCVFVLSICFEPASTDLTGIYLMNNWVVLSMMVLHVLCQSLLLVIKRHWLLVHRPISQKKVVREHQDQKTQISGPTPRSSEKHSVQEESLTSSGYYFLQSYPSVIQTPESQFSRRYLVNSVFCRTRWGLIDKYVFSNVTVNISAGCVDYQAI